MYKIGEYKDKIIKCLNDIERGTVYLNKGGRFDQTKDAEEFFRGLLNLFFSWNLKALNTEVDPNYEGADLGDITKRIAVQITSESSSDKVQDSILGFKNKCLTDGYAELYILMYKGKGDFPRANFAKTVDSTFVFEKSKHILDLSDLCTKIKDAEFETYIEPIYIYLDRTVGVNYCGLDTSIDDLGIIGEIYEFIQKKKPNSTTDFKTISSLSSINLIPKIKLNFPKEQQDHLNRLILKVWDKKEIVKDFIEREIEDDELSVNELIFQIQSDFCELRGSDKPDAKIEDISIMKELAIKYIPDKKTKNPNYIANAESLVFYFFEFCYIGDKTIKCKLEQPTLFD
jgi:hypothetical protein